MKEILGPRGLLGPIVVSPIALIGPRLLGPRGLLRLIIIGPITSISPRLLGPS